MEAKMALGSSPAKRGPSFAQRLALSLSFRVCELCDLPREAGSQLTPHPEGDPLWVCNDCQQKLARCIDDEGTLGG